MAENSTENAEAEDAGEKKGKGGLGKLIVWAVVAIVGIGAGFATPLVLMSDSKAVEEEGIEVPEIEVAEDQLPIPDPNEEVAYLPFSEDIVVNFNDPRFSRYLKMRLSLQIAKSQTDDITKLLEEKNDVLINWLISHIADKRVEDIRGKRGTNQLRREIHDSFNALLFTDGIERIQDILFQELNVQ
jgi:flagellar basal body-associated protein FliL